MRARYRYMIQVKAPDDGSLWLVPTLGSVGLASMGSQARHFPDAAEAESNAETFRRHNPGWGTKVVEDLSVRTGAS